MKAMKKWKGKSTVCPACGSGVTFGMSMVWCKRCGNEWKYDEQGA